MTSTRIPITIEDRELNVAEDTVLRVLAALDIDLYACRLCWNGDCDNCRIIYIDPEANVELSAKACLTDIKPNMVIRKLPPHATWPDEDLPINKLD